MRICEIYESIQGEGLLTGTPSVFVRTSGCNLRCVFCDTPYASWNPEGETMSVDAILTQVELCKAHHVVITGGEPMIAKDLQTLCQGLSERQLHITIETAGTVYQDVACDLMSISPKMANSSPSIDTAGDWYQRHEATRFRPEIVQQLIHQFDYQLKFVIDTPADADEALAYVDQLEKVDRDRILMMPEGTSEEQLSQRAAWLIDWCQSHDVRYCERAHIRWFGSKRGT